MKATAFFNPSAGFARVPQMTLCLLGSQSLERLEGMVRRRFEGIPNLNIKRPNFNSPAAFPVPDFTGIKVGCNRAMTYLAYRSLLGRIANALFDMIPKGFITAKK